MPMRPKFRRPAPQPRDIFPGVRSSRSLSGLGAFTNASAEGTDQDIFFRDSDDSERIEGVYIISVAARILEMHPQTLRKYERMGFVNPSRTDGMCRLYSSTDIAMLRLIKHLVDDLGMNLAGVEMVLGLITRVSIMRRRLLGAKSEVLLSVLEEEMSRLLD